MTTREASKIATTTATSIAALFAGQTATFDQVAAQIELEYTIAKRRTTFGSYTQIHRLLETAGVTSYYTGPNYTGERIFEFPAA